MTPRARWLVALACCHLGKGDGMTDDDGNEPPRAAVADVGPTRPPSVGFGFGIAVTTAVGFAVAELTNTDADSLSGAIVRIGFALVAFGLWRAVVRIIRALRKP